MSEKVIRNYLRTPIIHASLYIYIQFKCNNPFWADNAPFKSYRLPNKNPNTRYGKLSFELLAVLSKKTSKTLQAIDIALGNLSEVEAKSLLLKTPCTLSTWLELT